MVMGIAMKSLSCGILNRRYILTSTDRSNGVPLDPDDLPFCKPTREVRALASDGKAQQSYVVLFIVRMCFVAELFSSPIFVVESINMMNNILAWVKTPTMP